MQTRILGSTGLRVPIVSLGGSPLGGVFAPVEQSEATRAVHAAIDCGMNFIDTSPFYALTRAETVLGHALRGVRRDRYLLATKIGRYGEAEFDFSAARTRASLEESLARLGVDYVDVLHCHDIEFGSIDQVVDETIPTLRQLQQSGKARFIGVTGLPLRIFEKVLAWTRVDVILSYCRYNLNDTSLLRILPLAESANAGVIHAAPFGMGLLTHQGPPAWHPAPQALREACRRAAQWCQSQGLDLARIALQFSAANPRIHTVVAGASSVAEVEANAAAVEQPLDEQVVKSLQEIFAPVRDMTWPSGRPENQDA